MASREVCPAQGGVKSGSAGRSSFGSSGNSPNFGRVGRPRKLSVEERERLLDAYFTQPFSLRELGSLFGVSRMTVLRTVRGE